MLARAHRLTTASDYRTTIRRGQRLPGRFVVLSVVIDEGALTRFGFVVSKKVGNAPTRNLVRRRLKAIAFDALGELPAGRSIVMRALPGSADASWDDLNADVLRSLSKVTT